MKKSLFHSGFSSEQKEELRRQAAVALAELVSKSGFKPELVVGIGLGGIKTAEAVAKQLGIPCKNIVVRRPISKRKDLPKPVVSAVKLIQRPVVYSGFAEKPVAERILLVDASAHLGSTLEIARNHLIKLGIKPKGIRTASLYYTLRKPNFYVCRIKPFFAPYAALKRRLMAKPK